MKNFDLAAAKAGAPVCTGVEKLQELYVMTAGDQWRAESWLY